VQTLYDLKAEQGLTIVMISHEEALLRQFADELICLQDGAVLSHEILRARP
jgi:ABC-type methionine transport system ATPase subunit